MVSDRFGRNGIGVVGLEERNWHSISRRTPPIMHSSSTYRGRGTQQGNQTRLDDIVMDPDAPHLYARVGRRTPYIGCRLCVFARTNRVLVVVYNVEVDVQAAQRVDERRQGAVTRALHLVLRVVDLDDALEYAAQVTAAGGAAVLRG
jgi:hypothetical protein